MSWRYVHVCKYKQIYALFYLTVTKFKSDISKGKSEKSLSFDRKKFGGKKCGAWYRYSNFSIH